MCVPFTRQFTDNTFALSSQDKLFQEEYQFVSTEEQREEISRKLSEASNWMEEEGYAATTKVLLQCVGNRLRFPQSGRARVDPEMLTCCWDGFWDVLALGSSCIHFAQH